MDLYRTLERAMRMSEPDWARHASPLSVWTRFTCLPLLVLAIWSRVWIGWWSLVPVAGAVAWTYLNPRAFAPPNDYGAWASRGTLGERLFLARARYDIPQHHIRAAHVLTGLSALGVLPLIYGLVALDAWATAFGLVATVLPKVWFVDRMVWLHADVTQTCPGTPLPDPTLPQGRTPT